MDKSSRNIVYSQKFFDVEEENLILPNGKSKKYGTVHRKPISTVFPLTEQNELYLISQYRHMFRQNILEAVSGHADEGEEAIDAAKRELTEETGLFAGNWRKILEFYSSASVVNSHNTVFLAKDVVLGVASPEDDEDIKIVKISIKKAMEKILSGEIKTASTIIGVFLIDKMQREGIL